MRSIIRKILIILTRQEKKRLGTLLLLDIFISIADIASLALLLFVINLYASPGRGMHLPVKAVWLSGSMWGDRGSPALISFFLVFFLLKSMAGYFILRARYRYVYQVASRIAETNLLKYLEGDFSDYVNTDSAVHARHISQQPIEFCHHVLAGLQQAVTEWLLIILAVAGILWYDARLFLLLSVILSPGLLILSFITRKRLRSVRASVKTSSEKAAQYLQETISGFVESNVYDRNEFFTRRYAGYQQELNNQLAKLQITQGIPSRLIEAFAVLGLFILIVLTRFIPGFFNAEAFVTLGAFMAASYKIIPGIVRISNIAGLVKTYAFTVDGLVKAGKSGGRPRHNNEVQNIQSVSFRHVCFSHNGSTVLKDLSLRIGPGDFAGISGLSGKGKTTIVNLLLGFLKPDSGRILVNEKPAGETERYRYWRRIAYVKQQPFLLHDTILNNITLNRDQYDERRLKEAVALSGLDELIRKFPEGLDKVITEHGKNISGGQRQRIAIARALYKDADLIILDEPFNELDQMAERAMLEHFSLLSESGKMIILITHHKESFSFCTQLIPLNEQGSYTP